MSEKRIIRRLRRDIPKIRILLIRDKTILEKLVNDLQKDMETIKLGIKRHEDYFGRPNPESVLSSLLSAIKRVIDKFKYLEEYETGDNEELRDIGKKAKRWLYSLDQLREGMLNKRDYLTIKALFKSYVILDGLVPLLTTLKTEEEVIEDVENKLGKYK